QSLVFTLQPFASLLRFLELPPQAIEFSIEILERWWVWLGRLTVVGHAPVMPESPLQYKRDPLISYEFHWLLPALVLEENNGVVRGAGARESSCRSRRRQSGIGALRRLCCRLPCCWSTRRQGLHAWPTPYRLHQLTI